MLDEATPEEVMEATLDADNPNEETMQEAPPPIEEGAKEEPSPPKATKKKVAKKKSTGAPKGHNTGDLISLTSNEVENLDALHARTLAVELNDQEGFTDFKLGGVLTVINENHWYADYGYETFKDYVENEHGLKYRKAMYMVGIYTNLVEAQVEWENVKDVGWSKLKEIAPLLTQDNVDEWTKRANEMSKLQLIQYISDMKKGEANEEEASSMTTLTFKLHADQKEDIKEGLEQAKAQWGTEYDAVALHHLVMAYVSGGLGKQKVDVKEVLKQAGPKKILDLFDKVFPDIVIDVSIDTETAQKYGIELDLEIEA